MSSIPVPTSTPVHYTASLSLFLIWIAGGLFLVLGGLLAFAPFGFRLHKSDLMSRTANVLGSTEFNLAWTVIPVLVLVLFPELKESDRLGTSQASRSAQLPTWLPSRAFCITRSCRDNSFRFAERLARERAHFVGGFQKQALMPM
jgi:hypothetical protein